MGSLSDGADSIPPDILREAAAWFSTMADASASEEETLRWRQWLADPINARAWSRVEAVMGQFIPLAHAGDAVRIALVTPSRGRRKFVGALGVVLLAGGGMAALQVPWRQWRQEAAMRQADYRINIGKVATTVLSDGTRIWLGSLSVLDMDYGTDLRRLHLHQGDLLVETAIDKRVPARPFVVETPHGRLRALGTRFSVRADAGDSRVDVFEGAIELTPAGMDDPVHLVHAGEHAIFDSRSLLSVGQASVTREAWSRGMLMADRMRLDALVSELARWHAVRIVCDPEVAQLQVVGAYPLQDVDRILDALAGSLPVRILREDSRVRIATDSARASAAVPQAYDTPPRRIP